MRDRWSVVWLSLGLGLGGGCGLFGLDGDESLEGETDGDSDSDGPMNDPLDCSSIPQTIEMTWAGDRWTGFVSGTTLGHLDSFASTCGSGGSPDDAWRFVPPALGAYRFSLTYRELQGGVSVRSADCAEIVCDDGAAFSSSPHMPTMETLLDAGVAYTIVVEDADGYQLTVDQIPESTYSLTCGDPCVTSADCTMAEGCLSTTDGQICLPSECDGCFAQGLTCWSYPYTCGWIACS